MSAPILGTVFAADRIAACGIEPPSEFALCRMLLAAGYDPTRPLVTAWYDGRPSLRISSIGAGARFTVQDGPDGRPRLVNLRASRMPPGDIGEASPVRESGSPGTRHRTGPEAHV